MPQEGTRVGPQARPEYLAPMRDRYVGTSRTEKGRVLTEAVTVTGYHTEGDHSGLAAASRAAPAGPASGPTHAL